MERTHLKTLHQLPSARPNPLPCKNQPIVLFKCLCSLHFHKEIKLQKAMNGIHKILCKTDLKRT